MLLLLLFPFPFVFQPSQQNPAAADEQSPVVVVNFRWFRDRQAAENAVAPPRDRLPATISSGKNERVNGTVPEPDPNRDTVSARSAALDDIVEQSRESVPVEGFTYEVKFRNRDTKYVRTIFWEYQFKEAANRENVSRRRFACVVKIRPDKEKQFQVFSRLGPSNVISVKNLAKGSGNQFDESIIIDRVEYDDGSFWQRKDWNFDEAKLTAGPRGDRATVCRSF